MISEIVTEGAPQPRPAKTIPIDLPDGQKVYQVISFPVEHKKYPKWKFWRNQKVKYKFGILTDQARFYIVDPDNLTIEERQN
jgi:hypothetical protein